MNDGIEVKELAQEMEPSTESNTGTVELDLSHIQKFLFGSDEVSSAEQDKMAFIWEFISKQNTGPGASVGMISDIERSLSPAPVGTTRLDHLYSYVKLMSQQGDLDAELRAYRR